MKTICRLIVSAEFGGLMQVKSTRGRKANGQQQEAKTAKAFPND